MKRFPDIIVISWQCDCDQYMSHSIDLADINVAREPVRSVDGSTRLLWGIWTCLFR